MDEVTRMENKKVSDWLIWCDARETELLAKRENIMGREDYRISCNGFITSSMPSDPTGNRVDKLLELSESDKGQWIELIREIEAKLPGKMFLLVKLRRECRYTKNCRGRPGWIVYVQRRYAEEMALLNGSDEEDSWIERPQTFTEWWSRIVDFTARYAAKKDLL